MRSVDAAHEFILAHANGRRVGGELLFSCPSHSNEDGVDTHASFAYNVEKRVGLCRSCSFKGGAVVIATAMGWGGGAGGASPGSPRARTVVATYDYRDEEGALLFQVVRYEPKDFRQRRPDGRGGWVRD